MKVHYKMSFSTAGVIVIFISIYTFITINRELNQEKERFTDKIKKNNLILKNTLGESLWNLNDLVIERNMEFFLEDSEIIELVLFDNFSYFKKTKNESLKDEYHIVQKFTLKRDSFKIGELQIVYSNKIRRDQIRKHMYEIFRFASIIIIIIFILNYYILKFLNSPITTLLSAFKQIESGNLSERLDFHSNDEYKTISNQFNRMAETLEQDRDRLITKEEELKKANINAINYSQKLEKLNSELEIIITNRTEQLEKAKERAETANKAKDTFLANISHEMRTPLTPIIGFSKSLLRTFNEEPTKSKLEIIKNSGERLLNLTNELLKFSKIEKYEIYLEFENFSIIELLDNIKHENIDKCFDKNIKFEVFIAEDVPNFVFTDKMKLYEILTNLIQNAIKYTDKGFVLIEVEFQNNNLIFDVYDSGIGIAQEKLGLIFEAFEQLNNKIDGIGIGLNIVKRFIDALNGTIEVDSSVNNGTHFNITIPLIEKNSSTINYHNIFPNWTKGLSEKRYILSIKAILKLPIRLDELFDHIETKNITSLKSSLHSLIGVSGNYNFTEIFNLAKRIYNLLHEENLSDEVLYLLREMKKIIYNLPFRKIFNEVIQNLNFRILLAEDIKENQELIKEILDFPSLNIDVANDGEEALIKIKENEYDVVLMDIQMPKLSGNDVIEALKNEAHPFDFTVIALTAQALPNDKDKYLQLGFTDYVSKPIDEILLYSKLVEVFNL